MNTEADLPNSLDNAQDRNPIEYPFGFYIEDNHPESSGGSFFGIRLKKNCIRLFPMI